MEENFDREASEKNLEALDEKLKNVTSVFKIAEEKLRKARETTRTEEETMR